MSHMCPPFEFIVASPIVFRRPLCEKDWFPYRDDALAASRNHHINVEPAE